MGRPVLTTFVCVLVVFSAGCSGLLSGEGQPARTSTKPPTSTEQTTVVTTTDTAEQLAPGITTDGVSDALALANAHRENLYDHKFIKYAHIKRINATATVHKQTALYYANESHWLWNITTEGLPIAPGISKGTFVQYADGESVLYILRADENVSYGVRKISSKLNAPPMPPKDVLDKSTYERSLVYTLFANSEVTVKESNSSKVQVHGEAKELTIDGESVSDVNFNASITADGLVRKLEITYQQGELSRRSFEREITFSRTRTNPVVEPDWYSVARNRTE